jgi:hypothetical protein
MDEPHVYWLYRGQPVDCGTRQDLAGWHVDFTEHHYFFARPTLQPL